MSEEQFYNQWLNRNNFEEVWGHIKGKFVSGHFTQTGSGYDADWRAKARTNIGLGTPAEGSIWIGGGSSNPVTTLATTALGRTLMGASIGVNEVWYGSAANTLGTITTSAVGRALMGTDAAANEMWYVNGSGNLAKVSSTTSFGRGLLTKTVSAGKIWYSDAANSFIEKPASALGLSVLSASNNTKVSNLYADKADSLIVASAVGSVTRPVYIDANGKPQVITGLSVPNNVEAGGGVSALGLTDLSISSGGGNNDSITSIVIGDHTYNPIDHEIDISSLLLYATQDSTHQLVTAAQKTAWNDVLTKIPTAATSVNQLADKAFVNSSIQTATAEFKGTVTAAGDSESQAQTALSSITGMDNNDYAFVKVENTPQTGTDKYKRYKYNGTAWVYEYTLNNSSFTSDQWNAINSGVTSTWKASANTTLEGLGQKFTGDSANQALKLTTARAISISDSDGTNTGTGVNFDGSGAVTLKLPSTIKASLTGNASSASKLYSACNISISDSDASHTGSAVSFNGSTGVTLVLPSTIKATLEGNASSASRLSGNTAYSAWGVEYWASGVPKSISGNMSSVGNITFATGIKNLGGTLFIDHANHYVGVNKAAPTRAMDVSGDVQATGGVSALGLTDLSLVAGGGGSGTVTTLKFGDDGDELAPDQSGLIEIPVNDGSYANGSIVIGGLEIPVKGLGALAFLDSLSLGSITNATDIQAIQTISTGTANGFLVRASDGTWSFDTSQYAASSRVSTLEGYFSSGILQPANMPVATGSTLGGVKVGTSLAISSGVLNVKTGGVTNDMLAGSIANNKLANSSISLAGRTINLGDTVTQANLRSDLGLGTAAYKADTYFAKQTDFESAVMTLSGGLGTLQSMIEDNKASIEGHNDRITDLEGYFTDGIPTGAVDAVGFANNQFTWSKGGVAQTPFTIGYAAEAGKATNDKNGNDITATYLPLTGGVLRPAGGNTPLGLRPKNSSDVDVNMAYMNGGGTAMGYIGVKVVNNVSTPYFKATASGTAYGLIHEGNKNSLFTLFENDNEQLSATVGGVNKKVTVDYASKATDIRNEDKENQTFAFRQTAGGALTYAPTSANLMRVKGNTVVFNQIVKNGNFVNTNSWGVSSGSFSVSDNIATFSVSANGDNYVNQTIPMIIGHKYYFRGSSKSATTNSTVFHLFFGDPATSAGHIAIKQSVEGVWETRSLLFNCSSNSTNSVRMQNSVGGTTNQFRDLVIVDLTLMFGETVANAMTVEKFEALYLPKYYSYNAGQLINNAAAGLETVGFNQWDEEWEKGSMSSEGTEVASETAIRNKGYVKVRGNTQYYFRIGVSTGMNIFFYDGNKNFISRINGIVLNNTVFTTPSNACYIRFNLASTYGTTYNHDICINFSNPAKNGQYEPYRKSVLNVSLNSFKVKDAQANVITITGGLKSAGLDHDEIVGNKYTKFIFPIDLSSLQWNYQGNGRFSVSVSGIKNGASGTLSSVICTKYITTTPQNEGSLTDKSIYITPTGYLNIVDTDYSTREALQAALAGVEAYYAKAVPEFYELVDPLPTSYPIDVLGTESIVSDGLVAPFLADIRYGAKQGDILASGIPWDRLWNKPSTLAAFGITDAKIEKGTVTGGEWFKVTLGDKNLYIRFVTGTGAFNLEIADNDTNPTLTKSFEFGTLTTAEINTICS